jgi:hypothetical protein
MRIVASLAAAAALAIAMPALAQTRRRVRRNEPGRLHGGMDEATPEAGSVSQSQAQASTDFRPPTLTTTQADADEFMSACGRAW